MKKIGTALLLLLSLSLLFSCRVRDNNNEEDNSHNVENTLWSPSTDTAVVIADGGGWDVNEFVSSIYNLTGKPVTVTYDASVSYEHEIVFGESDRISSGRAYRQLEGMLEGKEDRSGWCIYALGGSVAIAYDNEVSRDAAIAHFVSEYCKSSTLVMNNGLIASESFDLLTHINELRAEMREKEFAALEQTLGAGTAAAIKSLYSLYTEDIYIWMANLYDPDTGGFYFSNSARDNIGFLPDIESTVQILNFLGSSGLLENYGGSYSKGIPASVREQLVNFAMGLQSDVDGYFYHPQWGDNIINARRGRDLGWATQMLEKFGEKPLYDTPDGIKGSLGAPGSSSEVSLTSKLGQSSVSAASKVISASKSNLPAFLQSMDAWKKYVADLGINTDSYTAGNDLAAMHTQITMAGKEYVDYVIKYLDEHQDPETGLWEPKKTEHQGTTINSYNAINGLFKITHLYYYLGVSVPNAEAAIQSVIDVVLQDSGDTHVCSVYNPWITFDLLLESIESSEGKKRAEEIQSILIENSEALVKATFEKIADYREGDGGFSYRGDKVQLTSQKALVACATTPESDVNATCISTTGIALNIFDTQQSAAVYECRLLLLYKNS